MDKYSTVSEVNSIRKEKIHMNMLERKLLAGRYDEAE